MNFIWSSSEFLVLYKQLHKEELSTAPILKTLIKGEMQN